MRNLRLPLRLIEILGEAATKVSQDKQAELTQIPWREVIGMRNRIVHAYFDIDYDIVWDTVTLNVPALTKILEAVLSQDA